MATVAVVLLSALLVLTGVSIYSALMLSKRTDEIVTNADNEDESPSPLTVHFPDSVMRTGDIS